jgi:hypothetical protein
LTGLVILIRDIQNNLTDEGRKANLSLCPNNQDLIQPVHCIILWGGELMEKRYLFDKRQKNISVPFSVNKKKEENKPLVSF